MVWNEIQKHRWNSMEWPGSSRDGTLVLISRREAAGLLIPSELPPALCQAEMAIWFHCVSWALPPPFLQMLRTES